MDTVVNAELDGTRPDLGLERTAAEEEQLDPFQPCDGGHGEERVLLWAETGSLDHERDRRIDAELGLEVGAAHRARRRSDPVLDEPRGETCSTQVVDQPGADRCRLDS